MHEMGIALQIIEIATESIPADAGEVRGDIVREAERKLRADLSREDKPDAPSDRVVPAE